jgi:hypothetical protein
MPYITEKEREFIDWAIDGLSLDTPGKLNYAITQLLLSYINLKKTARKSVKYQDINDILGALEGAKLEFYRRFAAKYENDKKKENGDVY